MEATQQRIRWFVPGDINGFFGLMVDNVAMLAFLAAILLGCGFPAEVVLGKMFPGTALGVLFGDLVYSWMAWRLAKRTGRANVTSMPLGWIPHRLSGWHWRSHFLSLTSGSRMLWRQRSWCSSQHGRCCGTAAEMAWYVGMAIMVCIGLSRCFCLPWALVAKLIPGAALLGSLAGIGLHFSVLPLVTFSDCPSWVPVARADPVCRHRPDQSCPSIFPVSDRSLRSALYYLLPRVDCSGYSAPLPSCILACRCHA